MQGQIQDLKNRGGAKYFVHAAHNTTVKRDVLYGRGPESLRAWKLYRVLNALSCYLNLNLMYSDTRLD